MKITALVKIGKVRGYTAEVRYKNTVRKSRPFKNEMDACEWAADHALRMENELSKSVSRILRDSPIKRNR